MNRTISIIVTARNEAPEILAVTLNGLLETSAAYRSDIVIIDDGSTTPVDFQHPRVRIVRNETALGVAQSRRLGASLCTGDVLVCTDAHMSFAPDWLEHMLKYVDTGSLLCAGWWSYDLSRPLCWGAEFKWCGERDYKAGRTPGLTFRHRTRFPGDGAIDVPMVIGACYMMLRETYHTVGGFSPFFRTWGRSEQDLSARAQIMGVGVKCVSAAKVGHLSRSKFPYPVRWSDIEFNQLAMVRTVFEEPAALAFEQMLRPLPPDVETWASEADFTQWRSVIQSRRQMSDAEFFRRFVPDAPACLM